MFPGVSTKKSAVYSLEPTVYTKLSLWTRNPHVVHDLVQIIRYQAVSRPPETREVSNFIIRISREAKESKRS